MPDLQKMSAGEFARRLKSYNDMPDNRFAFFLGAGCSITSGIPGTASLVKDHWLPRLKEFNAPDRKDTDAWAKELFPAYDPSNPAASYGRVMERCFTTPEHRQQEIERLCNGKFPGFGYTVLAKLIAQEGGKFNVVVTTNFDDLVSDALYLFTNKRPLVIGHESLAGFIRPTRTRPLVVKLHGDAHLAPRNTSAETKSLQAEVERQVSSLLNDRGLIVMGYGGNDESIATLFKILPKDALPLGIYWVSGVQPQCALREWLEERNAIWVEQFDFDEMMLLIRDVFELPHPDEKLFDGVLQKYDETYKKLSDRVHAVHAVPTNADDETLKNALERADKDLRGWLSVAIEANKFEKTDPEKARTFYKDGLEKFPNCAPLLNNYALFLENIYKNYDQAEEFYQRALALDPNNADILGNYALFVHRIRKDYKQAEEFYQRTLTADSNHANNLGNYAAFLKNVRQDYEQAEKFYRLALTADPNHVKNLGNYANFLRQIRQDYKQAEEFYLRALAVDPNHAYILGAYAFFLYRIRRDNKQAEEFYQRALDADPSLINNLGNYAGFLLLQGKYDAGYSVLDKAIALLPIPQTRGLAAELWFYAFCHWPENKREAALKSLKVVLLEGDRSPEWDLFPNIERARQDGHPDIQWLELLVDVITKGEDVKKLEAWPAWQNA